MNDPKKNKNPINAYLAANPNGFSKSMLNDWKKRFNISSPNKVVQIASLMRTKPENRLYGSK